MNTSQLSSYAREARRAFITAVSAQAARLGITAKGTAPTEVQGDVLLVGGQAFPVSTGAGRTSLVKRVEAHGFDAAMEAVAYTWFNRFVAIRYMEMHGYLEHGYRVLSHPEGQARPEILDHAADIDLPGLDREKAIELKLDGNQDEGLYRLLLLAQCNALHQAMPFLFEKIGDETELLLPGNLLHTDSLIRQLVEQIDEALWQEIEIIGWLYQFYISEKKDQVIGKVVASEDIPAATQLFTPNWIVKYMVQNSLGAQWLATYPQSPLKGQMEYYIEPAEQTDDVKAQLASITPKTLNPEELTLIDPASGSGHILVEAYELFKAIYLERGYRQRDVPQLILEKNLYGLDIDERAAQLTGFALMMKGRADDRRLFERGVNLNVMALVDSTGLDAERVSKGVELSNYGLTPGDLTELKRLFEHATTFGSLIQVPERLAEKLPALHQLSEATSPDMFVSEALKQLGPLLQQAELLAAQYGTVVVNPPYLSTKGMTAQVKSFLQSHFPLGQKDTFAAFMLRATDWAASSSSAIGVVTPFSWMYLSSFEFLRRHLFVHSTIDVLVELETNAFEPAMVTVCSFVFSSRSIADYSGCYVRLSSFRGAKNQAPRTLEAIRNRACGWFYETPQDDFRKIPGSPLAYWVSGQARRVFENASPLADSCKALTGMRTGDNERFLREWHEISWALLGIGHSRQSALRSAHTWFPYNKGGGFQKWFGNNGLVVNWANDGEAIKALTRERYPQLGDNLGWKITNEDCYFRDGITWSGLTSSIVTFRYSNIGALFDSNKGAMMFPPDGEGASVVGFLSSRVVSYLLNALNPTFSTQNRDVDNLPYWTSVLTALKSKIDPVVQRCIDLAVQDGSAYERSWDFRTLPILTASTEPSHALEPSYTAWITQTRDTIAEMKRLEEENNRLFIDAYGLGEELSPDVPIEQITLTVNPAYRYGAKLTDEEQWLRFRQNTMEELVSYAIGCMMGRYSLDAPGLIYAHGGNEGFDASRYTTFPADGDGIVPLTDTEWFDDDAAHRLVEFLSVAWDAAHLETNLTFLADNLSPKKHESSRETLRRYLCDSFFKDHLQTYKKRPIYWLFSSGKQKAFQCLVYLHRYNAGTLARMRSEYVIPLQGKIAARLEKLQGDIQAATSTAQGKRLEKERATLDKQQRELLDFDETLRHYADRRITLDLDDGVKVNYGKFGNLLAEVKAVTGSKAED